MTPARMKRVLNYIRRAPLRRAVRRILKIGPSRPPGEGERDARTDELLDELADVLRAKR